MDNRREFLEELAQLTLKHGIVIGGCGCCGSPFLTDKVVVPGVPHKEYKRPAAGRYVVSPRSTMLEWEERS